MNKRNISQYSLPIQANVPVIFKAVGIDQGRNKVSGKKWISMDFLFEDMYTDKYLRLKMFRPKSEEYMDRREYANILSEIMNTMSGENLWETLQPEKYNWFNFFKRYIALLKPYQGTNCFIKTTGCTHYSKKNLVIACLCENNFISLRKDLKYDIIETSTIELNGYDTMEIEDDSDSFDPKVFQSFPKLDDALAGFGINTKNESINVPDVIIEKPAPIYGDVSKPKF